MEDFSRKAAVIVMMIMVPAWSSESSLNIACCCSYYCGEDMLEMQEEIKMNFASCYGCAYGQATVPSRLLVGRILSNCGMRPPHFKQNGCCGTFLERLCLCVLRRFPSSILFFLPLHTVISSVYHNDSCGGDTHIITY